MAIKRFTSEKDNVITNAYKFDLQTRATDANMGQSDIVEVFTIYGQQSKKSLEKSRILMQFPIKDVSTQRTKGNVPASGSVRFVLRMFNAEHGQSVPRNYYLNISPLAQAWDEGYGLDMETYVDSGASNWVSSSEATARQITKFSFLSASAAHYGLGYVSMYDIDDARYNFWFKTHSSSSAPTLDGNEYEVDVVGKTTPAGVATAFRNFVHNIDAFSAYSVEGDSTKVLVTNVEAGTVTNSSISSPNAARAAQLQFNTLSSEVLQVGTDATLWTSEGGSTWVSAKDNGTNAYSQQFVEGREDLEVDVTGLVEEWIKGVRNSGFVKASGSVTINSRPVDNSTISLVSTDGLKREYRFMSSGITNAATGSSDSSIIFVESGTKSVGTITTTGSPGNNEQFALTDADGLTVTYIFKTGVATVDGSLDSGKVIIGTSGATGNAASVGDRIRASIIASDLNVTVVETAGGAMTLTQNTKGTSGNTAINMDGVATTTATNFTDNLTTIASNLVSAISSVNAHHNRYTVTNNSAVVSLTQSEAGFGGNTKLTPTGQPNLTHNTYMSGGAGANNYGVQISLSGSYEDGSLAESFYTKKFFARGSEFKMLRPILEARWDSSVTDDRNDFYLSSSLLSATDNLNSLYLYNYFRGALQDIPSIGTGNIYVKFKDSAGTEITTSTPRNPVTGTHVSTGIYRANFALTTNSSSVTDVWFVGSTEYHTGKFEPKTHASTAHRPDFNYTSKPLNLKSSYSTQEKPRIRLYVRQRDWSPNIYTVASKKIETSVIKNAYYRLRRVADDLTVINYGTGSVEYTKLSYDASGSYFDLDMSILESGYSYELSIVYKLDNDYKEQNDKFRFRVEK